MPVWTTANRLYRLPLLPLSVQWIVKVSAYSTSDSFTHTCRCVFAGYRSAVMTGQQKLLSLWIWLLLMAALCPGVQYAYGKRGSFKGRGKGDGDKGPPSQGRGLPKQGLKWAGAAAAGMLGGTGTGYGLGFLGRPKHGSGSHYSHKTVSSGQDQQLYHNERQGFRNQSLWRAFVNAAAPVPTNNILFTLGHVVSFLIAVWIRDIWYLINGKSNEIKAALNNLTFLSFIANVRRFCLSKSFLLNCTITYCIWLQDLTTNEDTEITSLVFFLTFEALATSGRDTLSKKSIHM